LLLYIRQAVAEATGKLISNAQLCNSSVSKVIKKLEALQNEVGISSTIGLACIAAHKKLNDTETANTSSKKRRGMPKPIYHNYLWNLTLTTIYIFLIEEKRDAEADLPQLPMEPDSDDDLYISHSIYQEPEWKRWLVEPRPGPATDILKYWAAKQYQYPIIAAIAQDHLAIPATSAPSERVFSNGADILTKKRNRLSPETLRYLLCLRDWGHILDTEESEAEDADDEREE
ncbi:hypothetical protein V500_02558, partial [Pseudogymnoascus sp. VKM F-4518 (FW-2643)]